MFSPCPGYPVPLIGAWRPVDYEMNWLGWHAAELIHEPELVPEGPDHVGPDQPDSVPPVAAGGAPIPASERH
jgi:hypothetical protein